MLIQDITALLETHFPLAHQESYDNSGLIIGKQNETIQAILVCTDCTEETVNEAISKGCNLIISHHPPVFQGIKKLNAKNETERIVEKAIKNDIAIYSAHTNMDNSPNGVNEKLCSILDIKNKQILQPSAGSLKKIITYCPERYADRVRNALFDAGAGSIGNYENCSFNVEGIGTFKAGLQSNPFVGEKNKLHNESEIRIETLYQNWQENKILNALFKSHPYEEVAYDLFPLSNLNPHLGAGMIGELNEEMTPELFLSYVKERLNCVILRHNKYNVQKIKKVSVCGGSGAFLISKSLQMGADAYITGDIKYHQFQEPEGNLLLIDAGHFETEQFTKNHINDLIIKKFPNFAVYISEIEYNQVSYY